MDEIEVEVWGDFACFSRPESKVERLSYPVITPSAARGILSAIYSKPVEFYWQVTRIEVLKPIRFISFKRNEVKSRQADKSIIVEDDHTPRQSVVLKDVRYRISAIMIKQPDYKGSVTQLYEQARRRIKGGKCFYQPSLGLREFVCYFDEPTDMKPINEDMDIGLMLYDVFDLHKHSVDRKCNSFVTLYYAKMQNGIINVPDFDSDDVIKPKGVD